MAATDHTRHLALGLALTSIPILSWGLSFVVIKTTLNEIPPLTLAFLRHFIALLIVGPLAWRAGTFTPIARADRLPIFCLGFFGVATYFAFENFGLKYTSASHGALIIATIPLATELYGVVRLRLALKPMVIGASFTALAGVYLLVNDQGTPGTASALGDVLIIGAVFSWVVYNSFAERLVHRYPHLFLTFTIMVTGAASLAPGALVEWFATPYPAPSLSAWLGVGFLTVFCSILGYHCWNLGIAHLGVSMTNNLLYLLPLLGVGSGVLVLGEPLTPEVVWGALLIIGGVIGVHLSDNRPVTA